MLKKNVNNDNLKIKKAVLPPRKPYCNLFNVVSYNCWPNKSFLSFLALREWQKKKRCAPHGRIAHSPSINLYIF